MAGKEQVSPRLISKEGANHLKFTGLIGGIIFLIAEMATLAIASIGIAGSAVIYDAYRDRKKKNKSKPH